MWGIDFTPPIERVLYEMFVNTWLAMLLTIALGVALAYTIGLFSEKQPVWKVVKFILVLIPVTFMGNFTGPLWTRGGRGRPEWHSQIWDQFSVFYGAAALMLIFFLLLGVLYYVIVVKFIKEPQ